MLIRIKGIVENIDIVEGVGSKSGRPWSKKVYTIRDNAYDKEEYNKTVLVNDFGKLDPNKTEPEYTYKSNHIVGEVVDLACYIETNEYGFTNVDYGMPYEDIGKPKSNVTYAEPKEEPAPVEMQTEEQSSLPF